MTKEEQPISEGLKAFNSIKETWKWNIPESLILIQKDNMEIIEKELKKCMNSERALQIIQRFPMTCTIQDIKLMCAYSDYHYYVQASNRDRQGVLLEESDWNILKKYFGYA